MHIVCPHCHTSYAITLATLGEAGRTVRCARCKEVWLARPEDTVEPAIVDAMAEASHAPRPRDVTAEWETAADDGKTPVVASPPLAAEWQSAEQDPDKADWIALVRDAGVEDEGEQRPGWFGNLLKWKRPRWSSSALSFGSLTTACAAMAALVMALIVWRAEMVRLLPQTARFYGMVGLNVNLRGLAFRDVKVTTETVDGKPVLVIEGAIVGEARKPVDLPRLRFSVRDAQGAEIYAWNTVLDQTTLNPGDHASFKSRLASPPAEGRSIDIRFFNKRDIAGGSA